MHKSALPPKKWKKPSNFIVFGFFAENSICGKNKMNDIVSVMSSLYMTHGKHDLPGMWYLLQCNPLASSVCQMI